MSDKKIIIAIDGPAGSGKSTTAKLLAKKLDYNYIDTGAMYRAVTFFALEKKIPVNELDRLVEMTKKLNFTFIKNGEELVVNSQNISLDIRKPIISENVSEYSCIPEIRKILVLKQKELGKNGGVVMEGRDITTTVFPEADLKVYLTAEINIRAERRLKELSEKGMSLDYNDIKNNLQKRDTIDSSREVSPLSIAKDAIVINTTEMTIEEQVDEIFRIAMIIINQSKG